MDKKKDWEEQMYLMFVTRDDWYTESEGHFVKHRERERWHKKKLLMWDIYGHTHTLQSKGRGQNV